MIFKMFSSSSKQHLLTAQFSGKKILSSVSIVSIALLFTFINISFAEDQSREVLVDFTPDSLPVLNDILNNIRDTTVVSYPISVANGGTGSATKNFVDLTTAQSVAGVKTFGSFPATPSSAPTTNYQVANKTYVDDSIPSAADLSDCFPAGTEIILHTNAPARQTTSGTYVKMKESTLNAPMTNASMNIRFTIHTDGTPTVHAYGKIYVNGVAKGTGRDTTNSADTVFTELITGLNEGDLIQIYGYSNSGSNPASISNLIILVDYATANGSY